MSAPLVRVLVVDDSPFMLGVLPGKIETNARFKVVGTAANGREAIEKTLALKPDIVTLDIDMPVMNGIEALKEIVKQSTASVIMLSARTEQGASVTLQALEIGAVDFIPKSRGVENIHDKLLAVAEARANNVRRGNTRPSISIRPKTHPRGAAAGKVNAKICVIGSSTGGPQALQAVLTKLPANLPVPVVIAQHMPPHFTMALAKRLNDICKPNIVEAKDGDALKAGTVYIAPGGLQTKVSQTHITVGEDTNGNLYKPSVDALAESARTSFGKNILGVMLTGMGGDGAAEFTKLKKMGGYNISQDQNSCVVYGMPRTLVESGGASEVLPLDQIGARICSALGC